MHIHSGIDRVWHLLAVIAVVCCIPVVSLRAQESKPSRTPRPTLRTAPVWRGDIAASVRAEGTVEPTELIEVNARVSGRITQFGPDPRGIDNPDYKDKPIDFNSPVEEGTLLAQLDRTAYAAEAERERAAYARAVADATRVKIQSTLAEAESRRAAELAKSKTIPQAEAETTELKTKAAKAAVEAAEAAIAQSWASLRQAEMNLDQTRLTSPIKGTIILIRAKIGEVVGPDPAKSSLFLVAKDLKKMNVVVPVDEAYIGDIREGQLSRFTVMIFPGLRFEGLVGQVRSDAVKTQFGVTYNVVIEVDNADGKLKPYMSAEVEIETARHRNVLTVPAAALRWQPRDQWVVAGAKNPQAVVGPGKRDEKSRRVWVEDGEGVRPLDVQVGITDGRWTEITGDGIKEGLRVVVGVVAATQPRTRLEPETPLQKAVAVLGNTDLIINARVATGVPVLTIADAKDIVRNCPAVGFAVPLAPMRARVAYGDRERELDVWGTTEQMLSILDWEDLADGEPFTEADVRDRAKVCLIGDTVARKLFAEEPPLGKKISVRGMSLRVIGVLAPRESGIPEYDVSDVIISPWTTVRYGIGGDGTGSKRGDAVNSIYIRANELDNANLAVAQVHDLMRIRHHLRQAVADDFDLSYLSQEVRAELETTGTLKTPLPVRK